MRQPLCWTVPQSKCISTPAALKEGSNEATERSRGGFTNRVHEVTDGLGNPLRFLLSSGNRNDICLAREILEPFELTGKLILADRGYGSDRFVCWIKEQGGIPVIPSRNSARHPRKTDWHTYKEQHLIENLFLKPKNHRRFFYTVREESCLLSCGCFSRLHAFCFGYFDGFKTGSRAIP